MMVVAFLHGALLGLKPQYGFAVFAHATVHVVFTVQDLSDPIGEGFDNLWMVVQVTGFDEFDLRVFGAGFIGEAVYPVNKHTCKQEVGEHNDPLVAKLGDMIEARLDQREGHTGIADLGPAKTHAFLQQPRHFRNVGIGIRVRSPAPDNHKAGFMQGDFAVLGVAFGHSLVDPVSGGIEHFRVHPELTAVIDLHAMFGSIGVEHSRDIIFGVHRGKQHTGDGQYALSALGTKRIKPVAHNGVGEFQVAVIHRPIGEMGFQPFGNLRKFIYCFLAAGPMPADHHSEFGHCLALNRVANGERDAQPDHHSKVSHMRHVAGSAFSMGKSRRGKGGCKNCEGFHLYFPSGKIGPPWKKTHCH